MLDVFDRFVVEDSSDKDALSSDLILSILQSADVAMTHFDFFFRSRRRRESCVDMKSWKAIMRYT